MEDFGPAEAAQTVLQSVASATGADVLQHLLPFINTNFSSPTWQLRDTAIMCMALVQGSIESSVLASLNTMAIPHIINILSGAAKDASPVVRSSAVFCLGEMAEHHLAHCAGVAGGVPTVVNAFALAVGDEPGVARQACVSLGYFLEAVADAAATEGPLAYEIADGKGTVFSAHIYQLLAAIIARGEKPDASQHDLRSECMTAVTAVVEIGREQDFPVLEALLRDSVLPKLNSLLAPAAAAAADRMQVEQSRDHQVGLVHAIVAVLGDKCIPYVPTIMGQLLQVVDTGSSASEAWLCMGLIPSIVLPAGQFAPYFDAVHARLLAGLANFHEYETCRPCIYLMSDMLKNLAASLPQHVIDAYINCCLQVLESQDANRDLKTVAIAAFGDVGTPIMSHLARVLPMISGAAALPDSPDEDEDLEEYLRQLRHSCVAAWVGIFQAFDASRSDDANAQQLVSTAQANARQLFSGMCVARACARRALRGISKARHMYANPPAPPPPSSAQRERSSRR